MYNPKFKFITLIPKFQIQNWKSKIENLKSKFNIQNFHYYESSKGLISWNRK